jgi:hypothetical protein
VHQLGEISRVLTQHARIDLFRQRPMYAFSSLTALTAVSLLVPTYGWTLLNPEHLQSPITIPLVVIFTIVALAAFFWPLMGVHRLLKGEKDKLVEEISVRLEAAIHRSHQLQDDEDMAGLQAHEATFTSLETQNKALGSMPTWPWQPQTLGSIISAIGLPLFLWLAQYILQMVLG